MLTIIHARTLLKEIAMERFAVGNTPGGVDAAYTRDVLAKMYLKLAEAEHG